MIRTIFKDFYQFLKKPDDRQIELSFSNKIRFTAIVFIAKLIVVLVLVSPLLEIIDNLLNLTFAFDTDNWTISKLFFLIVLVIPFIEEVVFRYFLRYQGLETLFIKSHRWDKLFPFLVYSSAISFGFIHLINYTNDSNWFYILSPFIVGSQLIAGFLITYVRVRLSFFWGLFFHCSWNFLFAIVVPALEDVLGIV